MKNAKRLMAMLLCAAMCFSLLPVPALAEEGAIEAAEQEGIVTAGVIEDTSEQDNAFIEGLMSADETKSENDEKDITLEESRGTKADDYLIGQCGNSMFWTLYNDGSFTVSGNLTGPMDDYSASERPGWYEHRARIWTARFGTVTNVGHFAMTGCFNMTSVTMEKVIDIGNSSFAACTSLPSIVIPATVKTIGNYAFAGCEELKEIIFEGDAPTFGEEAFKEVVAMAIYPVNASGWTESVRQDYEGELTWINGYCGNSAYWTILDGVLVISGTGAMEDYTVEYSDYSENSSTAPWFKFRDRINTIVIQNGITKIGDTAFYGCTSVTNVTIPNSVTSIGDSAFYGCTALTNVTIPDGVTEIGYRSFGNCSTLTEATIGNGVTSIGGAAFEYCSSLTEIVIPDSVTEIGYGAFRECSMMTAVTIGNGVTNIGGCAFESCSSLAEIVIPDSVTEIGYEAFKSCSMLTKATIGNGVTTVGKSAFGSCESLLEIVILGNASIGESAFEYCEALTDVDLGDGITDIGTYAFCQCNSLTSIEIPGSVTSIGNYAFYDCDLLAEVVIWDGVTSIGNSAFSYCCALTGIVIPDSVTSFSPYSFSHCTALKDAVIGNGVTTIPGNAFSGCTSLESVMIGNNVTYIDQQAFYNCRSLVNITFGAHLESTGYQSFYGCYSLTEITLPESVTTLGDGTFWNCISLTDVELPSGLISIGEQAFFYCSSLEEITIPDTVTSIGDNAFSGCDVLESIFIPAGVTSIGGLAFYMCKSLEDIIVDIGNENYASLDGVLFNKDLTVLICYPAGRQDAAYEIPNGVTSIEEYAFDRCYALRSVMIPDSVTSIRDGAFINCVNLRNVTFGNNVEMIGQKAFNNCESLGSITIPDRVSKIDREAFRYCSSLTSVVIGNGVTSIGYYAFGDCEKLQDLTIGNSVTAIDTYAFSNCAALTSISLPDSVTNIGNGAFSECSSLVSVNIPSSVTSIGNGAFSECSSLISVNIPSNVTSIGVMAFSECGVLERVTIPASTTSLGRAAFSGCTALTAVVFEGDAPNLDGRYYYPDVFEGVTATAYYPADNETWIEEVRQSFGGNITWVAVTPGAPSNITSSSVDFNGKLYLNTYIKLSDEVLADPDAYVRVTFNGETKDRLVTDLIQTYYDAQGRVKVRLEMFAAMLRDEMTLQVFNGAGEAQPLTYKETTDVTDGFVYTALEYLKGRQEQSTNPYMVELAKAAELYGTAVQVYFDYHTELLTAEDIAAMEAAAGAITIPASCAETLTGTLPAGITKRTKTVMFESDNALRQYFYIDGVNIKNYTFTLNGETVKAKKLEAGKYYVQQPNIASALLSTKYTFSVSDGTDTYTIESSALGYAYDRQENSSDPTMVNLSKLLYRYSQAADAYFGQ